MNKVALLLILGLSATSMATTSLGGELTFEFTQHGNSRASMMELAPTLIFRPSNGFEVAPKFGINVRKGDTDFGILGGCGLFWHLIDKDPFSLSVGPEFTGGIGFGDLNNDNHTESLGIFEVGVPVNLDFLLSDRMFMRMALRVASLGLNTDSRDSGFEFMLHTIQVPSFAFFLNL